MTRNTGLSLAAAFLLLVTGRAIAQTNPVAGPAAPPARPTYGPVQPGLQRSAQPQAQQQPLPSAVRQVVGEQPIRQPQVQPTLPQINRLAGPALLNQQPPEPKMPEGFPLAPEVQAHVDQILAYWEKRSDQIKTYRCEFQRWDYDPVFGPKNAPFTFSTGVIQYANPDKGLFRVEKISRAKPGAPNEWDEQKGVYGEHWVCDGKKVFEFDSRAKRLIERALPPEMHGKAIADGPLPFLFGAKAATIKARYWIKAIQPPQGVAGQYWLEAHPKSRADAANFKMVLVVLDQADYLPMLLQVFSPNFDWKENPAKTAYKFDKREVNKVDLLSGINNLNPFLREFYEPKLPAGWKKEVENMGAPSPPQFSSEPRTEQATRPAPAAAQR